MPRRRQSNAFASAPADADVQAAALAEFDGTGQAAERRRGSTSLILDDSPRAGQARRDLPQQLGVVPSPTGRSSSIRWRPRRAGSSATSTRTEGAAQGLGVRSAAGGRPDRCTSDRATSSKAPAAWSSTGRGAGLRQPQPAHRPRRHRRFRRAARLFDPGVRRRATAPAGRSTTPTSCSASARTSQCSASKPSRRTRARR